MYQVKNVNSILNKRILLVEDEALIALSEVQELEDYGYRVSHVLSGEDAVTHLTSKARETDLILMDINLGNGIDGTEAARIILEVYDIPIIFLSSHTEPEIVQKTEMITSYGYIVKNTGITVIDASIKMAFKLNDTKIRLQNKDTEYKTLFHSMLNGFAIHEMLYKDGVPVDYRFLDVNRAFERITGLEASSVIGKTVKEILPMTEDYWIETYANVVKTGTPVSFTNYSASFDKHFKVSAFRSGTDQFASIFTDITEKIKAEQELKDSEERFKTLHNASFGGIAIHDNGIIIDCNQGLADISGYSTDELIGMDGVLLIAPDKRLLVRKNIQNRYEEPYEAMGMRKTGEIYPIRLHAKNIPYKSRLVRVVEIRDITETKRIERELKDAYNEKTALLTELQHRARNSFNTIIGLMRLKSEMVRTDEAKEVIQALQIRVEAMADLYSLLYESGSPNSVYMDDYLKRIISSLEGLSDKVRITLSADRLQTDSKKAATLGLIATELITNSIKHAFPGRDSGHIRVSFRLIDEQQVLTVADNGIGFPDNTEQAYPYGLGLRLVRVLASQIKGSVDFDSSGTDSTVINIKL